MNGKDGVSIVICCYNSSDRIATTLEYLQQIRTKIPWEVVVVDNASTDDTASKTHKLWNNNPVTKLTVVSERNPGLMNARRKGVEQVSYNIISFIDDDNWIESQWIDKVHDVLMKDPSIAACGGRSEGVFENPEPEWFSSYSSSFAVGKQQSTSGFVMKEKGYLWGAGLTVRKQAWDDLFNSGFTSLLKGRKGKSLSAGEDSEICFAWLLRGWKLWYDDSLVLKHFMPASRVSISYLERMVSGFGKAEVILSVYRDEVSGRITNKPSWVAQSLASVKNMCVSGLKSLFSSGESVIKNKVSFAHDKAYTLELISNRSKYNFAKRQVNKIKNSSRENTVQPK